VKLLPAFTESTIVDLTHEAYLASKQMMRTHRKDDILAFVRIAQRLQDYGFRVQWIKHHGCIGVSHIQGGHRVVTGFVRKLDAFSSGL
jgi:hypothetical protein